MTFQLKMEQLPGYLAVRFIGSGTAEEVWRQYELIAKRCKRANKNKLLLDFTEAHVEASLTDKYTLGEQAQIFARYKVIKAAAVANPEHFDPERFGEMVARNRGVNGRIFTSVEDAEEWLLSNGGPTFKRAGSRKHEAGFIAQLFVSLSRIFDRFRFYQRSDFVRASLGGKSLPIFAPGNHRPGFSICPCSEG